MKNWLLDLFAYVGRHFSVTDHYGIFRRYALIPRNHLFNVFVHVWYTKKEIGYHDHPWWCLTVRLWGSYEETLIPKYMYLDRGAETTHRDPRVVFRRATTGHKMRALTVPVVTLFITGRTWNVVWGRA